MPFQSSIRFGLMDVRHRSEPGSGRARDIQLRRRHVACRHAGRLHRPEPDEVGARNAAAPPWEGRLIPFGNPQPGSPDYQNKNQQIQQVLRASRPYGATPIAGMLADARDFLWNGHLPRSRSTPASTLDRRKIRTVPVARRSFCCSPTDSRTWICAGTARATTARSRCRKTSHAICSCRPGTSR